MGKHGKNKSSKNGSPAKSSKNGSSVKGESAADADTDAGSRGRIMTVTFRIPASLKESVSRTARSRAMTTTRFVVEALENAVNNEPPRWWSKAARSGGGRSRARARSN